MIAPISRALKTFHDERSGNIAITMALLLVPLIAAVGASLDYVRAYNVRSKMQADLDVALLAAVKDVATTDAVALEVRVKKSFAAQTDLAAGAYSMPEITIDSTHNTISASARSAVPTTLLTVLGVRSIEVSVRSSAEGPGHAFLNVYVVLDKSASMMLAATVTDQDKMLASPARCVFACHTPEGDALVYNGVEYQTSYELSVAMDVRLRTDVAITAVSKVLDMIDSSDPAHERVKIGLYTIGADATEVLSPTFSTADARAKLKSPSGGLTSATSEGATNFDLSLAHLQKMIGSAGDGATDAAPKKLVLMLTDGVQSERNWVLESDQGIRFPTSISRLQMAVTPLNPKWCDQIKSLNASFSVLYTEYLPMTWDWGYQVTVSDTMNNSGYSSIWGGKITAGGGPKTRQAYIPTALQECASSGDLFLHADSAEKIEAGLALLFRQYLSRVRLTS